MNRAFSEAFFVKPISVNCLTRSALTYLVTGSPFSSALSAFSGSSSYGFASPVPASPSALGFSPSPASSWAAIYASSSSWSFLASAIDSSRPSSFFYGSWFGSVLSIIDKYYFSKFDICIFKFNLINYPKLINTINQYFSWLILTKYTKLADTWNEGERWI